MPWEDRLRTYCLHSKQIVTDMKIIGLVDFQSLSTRNLLLVTKKKSSNLLHLAHFGNFHKVSFTLGYSIKVDELFFYMCTEITFLKEKAAQLLKTTNEIGIVDKIQQAKHLGQ